MSLIYTPKGKAREYSPLALNPYSGGCDHGCKYCYCHGVTFNKWGTEARPRNLTRLDKDAALASEQVLLSFMSDPYCRAELQYRETRKSLNVLSRHRCSVAILSKGGMRCLEDLEIFRLWPEGRIKVGATLTFRSDSRSFAEEPGAATPDERLEALKVLHENGIKTWASIEPVINPVESLAVIEASLPYVDAYKIGKLNHDKRAMDVDWPNFAKQAIMLMRRAGKTFYIKKDLQPFCGGLGLSERELDYNALNLPPRK